jgi:hypothetical protein
MMSWMTPNTSIEIPLTYQFVGQIVVQWDRPLRGCECCAREND